MPSVQPMLIAFEKIVVRKTSFKFRKPITLGEKTHTNIIHLRNYLQYQLKIFDESQQVWYTYVSYKGRTHIQFQKKNSVIYLPHCSHPILYFCITLNALSWTKKYLENDSSIYFDQFDIPKIELD